MKFPIGKILRHTVDQHNRPSTEVDLVIVGQSKEFIDVYLTSSGRKSEFRRSSLEANSDMWEIVELEDNNLPGQLAEKVIEVGKEAMEVE